MKRKDKIGGIPLFWVTAGCQLTPKWKIPIEFSTITHLHLWLSGWNLHPTRFFLEASLSTYLTEMVSILWQENSHLIWAKGTKTRLSSLLKKRLVRTRLSNACKYIFPLPLAQCLPTNSNESLLWQSQKSHCLSWPPLSQSVASWQNDWLRSVGDSGMVSRSYNLLNSHSAWVGLEHCSRKHQDIKPNVNWSIFTQCLPLRPLADSHQLHWLGSVFTRVDGNSDLQYKRPTLPIPTML